MKKAFHFVISVLVAVVGLPVADVLRKVYGLTYDYSNAYILGYGIYLCFVIVNCTCIIVSKLNSMHKEERE